MNNKGRSMHNKGFLRAVCTMSLGLLLASGCNEHPVGPGGGPEFRGITVPLPPPSFRSATMVDMAFSGAAPGFEKERVMAWDTEQQRGIAAPVDAVGNFTLQPWGINVQRHCIEVRALNHIGEMSSTRYYALDLASGAACQDAQCSVQDRQGECVCLLLRSANCVDVKPWPDAGSTQASTTGGADSTGSAGF